MNTLETLKAMDALFSSPDRWTQGVAARDKHGCSVYFGSSDAHCWCLIGAFDRVQVGIVNQDAYCALFEQAGGDIILWNDAHERTFEDVTALLARAIAAEEAKA